MYSLCMSPLATSLAFSTKLVNLPIKDELATDHVVYSLLLVNNFERPCFKQTEHFSLSRVHELYAMLTVSRLPERLGHAEVLGVAEGHVGPQVRRAHLAKSCVDILPRGEARRKACLLYTSPSPRDGLLSRMPSSA